MKTLFISIKIFIILSILTGIIYPLFITGIAQIAFPDKANGSIIYKDGKAIGSKLIGQQFDSAIYFQSRPSAILYQPIPSGGSNLSMTSAKLKAQINEYKHKFILYNQLDSATIKVPVEMMCTSASGLDPHISVESALLQVNRIANARHFNKTQKEELLKIIRNHTELPLLHCIGEKRINVLLLNLETDKIR